MAFCSIVIETPDSSWTVSRSCRSKGILHGTMRTVAIAIHSMIFQNIGVPPDHPSH